MQKPWEFEELKVQGKALPHMSGQTLKSAAMSFKASTGVGVDGFHQRIPMDLSDALCEEMVKCLHEVDRAVT